MSTDLLTSTTNTALRILTVGEGDLTLSLSLGRAYGDQIDLTATTLCATYAELCNTYSNSASVIKELKDLHVSVIYSVDATNLSSYPCLTKKGGFDLVLFHHPHLGLMTSTNSTDEQRHAQRHFVLLAHYMASAKSLLQPASGLVHLCLAHDQPLTWRMEEAAARQELQLAKTTETFTPFHDIVNQLELSRLSRLSLLPHRPEYSAPRKYRSGKLGSKHFLGKYGYQHRRTHGDNFEGKGMDMNVEGSKHYFFANDATKGTKANDDDEPFGCSICGMSYGSQAELQTHLKAPAFPDPASVDRKAASSDTTSQRINNSNNQPLNHPHREKRNTVATEHELSRESGSWNVLQEQDGKRLRRFLQHVAFTKRSRKQCDILVAEGQIQVNGVVARDQSRILKAGDVVSALTTEKYMAGKLKAIDMSSLASIPIVASYPLEDECCRIPKDYLLVANKPVGLRTKGDHESMRTLEQTVSWQTKRKYKSLSSLETGCNALCVLQLQETGSQMNLVVQHEFTALVYGRVPEDWNQGITAEVPWKCVRRWRRQKEAFEMNGTEANDQDDTDVGPSDASLSRNVDAKDKPRKMLITCTQRTSLKRRSNDDKVAPPLCTLQIATTCPASGTQQAIILYLRKQRFPVVGDSFCQKEYQKLPRSFRNRIKKKLLMGCFKVDVSGCTAADASSAERDTFDASTERASGDVQPPQNDNCFRWTTSVDIPERCSASFWQHHWDNAASVPPGDLPSGN